MLLLILSLLIYKNTGPLNITSTSAVPTNGGQLTIVGISFSHPLYVYLDNKEVNVTSFSSTSIECIAPSGSGKDHLLTVISGPVQCRETLNSSWSYPL